MSTLDIALVNTHPLRVAHLKQKFEVSAYTIREWARRGKLKGAKKFGREWRFALDVEYREPDPVSPALAQAVEASPDLLARYEVGRRRAA